MRTDFLLFGLSIIIFVFVLILGSKFFTLCMVLVILSVPLEKSKSDLIVMHPLPRVNEIAIEVDDDPRAKYFDQVQNGRFMRMALILKMLGLENEVER